MRPDIMFVDGLDEGWQQDEVGSSLLATMKAKCTVYLLEVGYCRDSAALLKRFEKKRQHWRLRRALRAEGWTVADVPVALGHCGSVYGHELDALLRLGVERKDALKLLDWLHGHAVRSTCGAARAYQRLRHERNRELGMTWGKGKGVGVGGGQLAPAVTSIPPTHMAGGHARPTLLSLTPPAGGVPSFFLSFYRTSTA